MGTSSMAPARRACSSAAAMPLCTHRLSRAFERQRIPVLRPIDAHAVALDVLPLEHGDRERILQQALDGALERPSAVDGIVALGDEQMICCGRDHDRELAVCM